MRELSLTERLLGPILRADAARPLITFYDDADGSRVELSGATLANWAAKCANWLRDECEVEPGDRVHVDLPAHWQTAGALLGAWWCGAHVVAEPTGAAVSLVTLDRAGAATAAVDAVVSLHPMGLGIAAPPAGYVDYVGEVRVHGDFFQPTGPTPAPSPALLGATVDQVATTAVERAAALGIERDARVLSTIAWSMPDGVTDGLLAVLAAGASLVHCANPDPAALEARSAAERVSLRLSDTRVE